MKKRRTLQWVVVGSVLAVAGCSTMPTGPSVMVLPAQGKTFEQFNGEDMRCRQWAANQLGKSPQELANESTASSSVLGTILGAGLGAAIGAVTGSAGAGAAIGAGSGLFFGTASGVSAGESSAYRAQRQYDIAYQQCMYAQGNQLPGMVHSPARVTVPPPPPY